MVGKGVVFIFLNLFFCFQIAVVGQGKVEKTNSLSLNGFVRDRKTGETLTGVVVYPKGKTNISAGTNAYGYYSLSLPAGRHEITFQNLGYQTVIVPIVMGQDTTFNVELDEKSISLAGVKITGEKSNHNVISPEVMTKMNVKEIQNIPVFFGEKDILKTIQLLPGISTVGEGNAGFYVRGGGADQNLILLDEATVYNPSHLLGFFSTFTSEAIKDVSVYKGGFPAEFGGRLSSVVNIKMNEGNNKEFHISGGIGLIASRLSVEGPLVKHKGSFMITARRTYADLFLNLLPRKSADSLTSNATLYFYDLNLKANYEISKKDRVYLSCYLGRDHFFMGGLGLNWGNVTTTARWNHIVNNHIFSNTSLIFSRYNYNFKVTVGNSSMNVLSEIKDWNLKEDFTYNLNPNHLVKFGFNSIYHTFIPSKVDSATVIDVDPMDNRYALENASYISNEQTLSKHLKATYGLRYSIFSSLGPATIYTYDEVTDEVNSVSYPKGKIYNTFAGFEPRLLLNYIINDSNSIKTTYARTRQYVHLLSNTTSTTPFDLWVPSNIHVLPEIADQYTLGYFLNFNNNMFETSVEFYYKTFQNQIDYRNNANLIMNNKVETQLVFGKGLSYGAEFYVRKKYGKLTGWLSYSPSKTLRQFEDINEGKAFRAKQDRPNNISVVGMYAINSRLNFSTSWVYYSGNVVTFPSGRYGVDGNLIPLYSERNGYRMPDYHRLDIGLTLTNKKKEKFESSWNFSVYNVYARENAYSIDFKEDPNNPGKMQAIQMSLFRMVPSITYNFKF